MRKRFVICLLFAALVFSCKQSPRQPEEQQKPADSISTYGDTSMSVYESDMTFTNQFGKQVNWTSLKGKVEVMAMVFTSCKFACPRITEDMKEIQSHLDPADTGKVGFVLISFDPETDKPAKLLKFYRDRGLDKNWQLLTGSDEDIQTVGALLDVKFKKMERALFSHENIITIVDKNGVIADRIEGLEIDAKKIAREIHPLVKK